MNAPKVSLEETCDFLSGFAWSATKFNSSGDGIPIIRIQNVDSSRDKEFIYWDEPYDKRFVISKGDLLLTLSGSFRVGLWDGPPALLNQRIVKLTPKANVTYEWLLHVLRNLIEKISSLGRHALVSNVALADLRKLAVPLPSVPEQRRIAAILDQADALRAKRREALAQLDSLTQSIFIEMFGDPTRNHNKFPVHSLGAICDVRDGTHDSPKYVSSGFPLVTTKNLRDGIIDFTDVNLISEADYSAINKRSKVDRGDLLMPMIGTIGSPILVCIEPNFAIKNMALIKFTEHSPHCQFILSFLQSDAFEKMVTSESKGGTQKFLSLGAIRGLQIPIPPLPLQKNFATRIQSVEALKTTYGAALQELNSLFASLQHRAFRGEL